jgi:N-acetylglutamate synthase-like GNAT family acetyltransferase
MPPLVAATVADVADIEALLGAAGLTLDGLAACVSGGTAVICREPDGCLLGAAATERHRDVAFLRSVAVHAPVRKHGLGLGWARAERADAPAAVAASVEFASACPATAIAMRRPL